MPDLDTTLKLTTRNRTILELPPQMSTERMLVNGAAGQTDEGYTTLTISDDTAELLAQILVRYNTLAQEQQLRGVRDTAVDRRLRVAPDHDIAFWDAIAQDLLVAAEIPPPVAGRTTMVLSIGKTADR
jgi:hypothetical protein